MRILTHHLGLGLMKYTSDKPHRCPACHAVTTWTLVDPPETRVTDFAEWLSELTEDLPWRHPLRTVTRTIHHLLDPSFAERKLAFASVTCCRCGTEFTRWPKLPVFKRRGVICPENHEPGWSAW